MLYQLRISIVTAKLSALCSRTFLECQPYDVAMYNELILGCTSVGIDLSA